MACYSRDLLSQPLRDLCGMLLNIRLQKFNPDGTRSGWMAEAQANFEVRADPTTEMGGGNTPETPSCEQLQVGGDLPVFPVFGGDGLLDLPVEEVVSDKEGSVIQECPPQEVLTDEEFVLVEKTSIVQPGGFDPHNPFGEKAWGDPLDGEAQGDPNEFDPVGVDGEEVIESASSDDDDTLEKSGDEGKEEVFHNTWMGGGLAKYLAHMSNLVFELTSVITLLSEVISWLSRPSRLVILTK